jgi:hypothetical protein
MSKPLVIDICCGLGGWTRGFLAEGWDCLGFDIERHEYGDKRYPAQLILKDILTLNGYDLRAVNPALVVASPPCQRYSWMAMPWSLAKREAVWQRWERDSPFGNFRLNALFDACFRIAREIGCPIVLENVKGAQPWVGRANAHYGSYYLWGDVGHVGGRVVRADLPARFGEYVRPSRGVKVPGMNWSGSDQPDYKAICFRDEGARQQKANVTAAQRYREGVKQTGLSGPAWFNEGAASVSSRSDSRRAASAMIAEIPFDLAQFIARVFKPCHS